MLKEFIEKITKSYTKTLEEDTDINKMLRAQGAKGVYRKLENEVMQVVEDAQRETNGEDIG